MHYLKCNNCGHLNEIKGEYLVFCSSCKKKLENNFTDWKRHNSEKTLDDFKQLICISETDIQTAKKTKSEPKNLKSRILIILSVAIFSAIGGFAGEEIANFFKSDKTSKEVLTKKWVKESYGNYGLTVETPSKLTKGNLKLPDNVKEFIEKMDSYESTSKKGMRIAINCIKYTPAVGQLSLQGAADGSINEVKKQKGVTNFDYTEDKISKNNIPGFIQKGTYQQNGFDIEFINTFYTKELTAWQVMVLYQIDDKVGRKAAERIIESIEIKK